MCMQCVSLGYCLVTLLDLQLCLPLLQCIEKLSNSAAMLVYEPLCRLAPSLPPGRICPQVCNQLPLLDCQLVHRIETFLVASVSKIINFLFFWPFGHKVFRASSLLACHPVCPLPSKNLPQQKFRKVPLPPPLLASVYQHHCLRVVTLVFKCLKIYLCKPVSQCLHQMFVLYYWQCLTKCVEPYLCQPLSPRLFFRPSPLLVCHQLSAY